LESVAKIVSIAKTGTTTATVTTDIPHTLAVTDFVQIYGVRDIVNFPNLIASTQVSSIISSTQFTIVIGAAVTASSAAGIVILNQGSVLAPGIAAQNTQSISRTNNILTITGNASWAGYLPGETVQLYGCNATSMGLYDGTYKVLRLNAAALEVESPGSDFGTINCGGAVMRRTDFRLNVISEIEHTRLIAELSNSQGSADSSKSIPVNIVNTPAVTVSSGTVTAVTTVTTVAAVTAASLNGTTTNGASTYQVINSVAASGTKTQVKSGAGLINSLQVSNSSASFRYLKVFNLLTGSVTLGATAATFNYAIPPNSSISIDTGPYGIRFTVGLTLAITTGSSLTDGTVASIGNEEVIVNATYY
jgi:hypothetical protein